MAKNRNRAAKDDAKKSTILSEEEAAARVAALHEAAGKFCVAIGLHSDLMRRIYNAENDWTFILKIDALLEMAAKEIIKSGLRMKILNRFVGAKELSDFVDGLPMNGKSSLLQLLNAAGCPTEDALFIDGVRRLRNAYAHNITLAELPLIDVIKHRSDKSDIIKKVSNVETFREASLVAGYEEDGRLLRFSILDATMRVLFFAYHIALK
ncbi:MAG: hypothetical protein JO136_22335 [Hyphomicrobiales bacterium]|nr:hypothetical protein [Hyphomicrobiales bacterium]